MLVFVTLFPYAANAQFDQGVDEACPSAWSLNTQVIPVLSESLNPWGINTDDKAKALQHFAKVTHPLVTIEGEPITPLDQVQDLLTVASVCLGYRSSSIDFQPSAEPGLQVINPALSWMPSVIF